MLFSSPRFFVFVAILLALLALPLSTSRKKNILAAASCFFYAAWDYRYLGLLFLISVIDYVCAARIHATDDIVARKRWVTLSVVSNLLILGYFKYTNFFLDNLNGILPSSWHLPSMEILLPAGISFYTFKSMSYTIDVYRREIQPCRSHLDYTTFITFFPELIAGPIVRASVFLPQMDRRIGLTRERLASGASLFLLGLGKKLLVADHMAAIADPIFANPSAYSVVSVWCGVLAYGIQIYADFAGYSDMAIGTAKLIGYDLPENFNMPYVSRTVTEFWRRWHITLSSWLRDYLYIPLGGNRASPLRTYVNLALTMLLGGLWHGASWNFVVWGALHGVALAVHRFISRRDGYKPWPWFVAQPITLLFVLLCWVPFRAQSFQTTRQIFEGLFLGGGYAVWVPETLGWGIFVTVVFHLLGLSISPQQKHLSRPLVRLLSMCGARVVHDRVSGTFIQLSGGTVLGSFVVVASVLTIFYFGAVSSSPFIYFQF